MKIDITHEERRELENILSYIQSDDEEIQHLGITLLRKYDKFKNTVFSYDFGSLFTGDELRYIKRPVDSIWIHDYNNYMEFFAFNNIFSNEEEIDLPIVAFYIKAILVGDNSFYIG